MRQFFRKKIIFKGSYPSVKFQDCILRYLGSRTRPPIQNWSVGVIFDVQQNDLKNFSEFRKFPIISELNPCSTSGDGPMWRSHLFKVGDNKTCEKNSPKKFYSVKIFNFRHLFWVISFGNICNYYVIQLITY